MHVLLWRLVSVTEHRHRNMPVHACMAETLMLSQNWSQYVERTAALLLPFQRVLVVQSDLSLHCSQITCMCFCIFYFI